MILHNIEQRSAEWYQIRIGKVTGSEFKKVMSKNWMDYADKIAAEQLTGSSLDDEDGFVSYDMQRGIDLEPLAASEYEQRNNIQLDLYGFIQSSKFEYLGLSPDAVGLEVSFGVEIKSPNVATHIRYIRHDKIPANYYDQILCYFVVCDSIRHVDFVSYCPDLQQYPYWQKRITRDEMQIEIEQAEQSLTKFFRQVQTVKTLIEQ
jgi:hypothetical protein